MHCFFLYFKLAHVPANELEIVEVYSNKVYNRFEDHDLTSVIRNTDVLVRLPRESRSALSVIPPPSLSLFFMTLPNIVASFHIHWQRCASSLGVVRQSNLFLCAVVPGVTPLLLRRPWPFCLFACHAQFGISQCLLFDSSFLPLLLPITHPCITSSSPCPALYMWYLSALLLILVNIPLIVRPVSFCRRWRIIYQCSQTA